MGCEDGQKHWAFPKGLEAVSKNRPKESPCGSIGQVWPRCRKRMRYRPISAVLVPKMGQTSASSKGPENINFNIPRIAHASPCPKRPCTSDLSPVLHMSMSQSRSDQNLSTVSWSRRNFRHNELLSFVEPFQWALLASPLSSQFACILENQLVTFSLTPFSRFHSEHLNVQCCGSLHDTKAEKQRSISCHSIQQQMDVMPFLRAFHASYQALSHVATQPVLRIWKTYENIVKTDCCKCRIRTAQTEISF